jgi:hypothetical protein
MRDVLIYSKKIRKTVDQRKRKYKNQNSPFDVKESQNKCYKENGNHDYLKGFNQRNISIIEKAKC